VISQSFIKAMNHGRELEELEAKDEPKCPAKAQAMYLHGLQGRSSEAMNYGNFMETILWGGTETGEKATIPRKGNGLQKREVQIRIEQNAWMLRNRWMEEMGMEITELRPKILIKLGERYRFRARMDFYSTMRDDEGVDHPQVIGDLKMAGSLSSTFGPYKWGDVQNMDHTQAVAYSWAHRIKHGARVPFWYIVVSYNKLHEYMRVEVKVDAMKEREFLQALQRTADLIETYDTRGRWPQVPSRGNCGTCPLKDRCPSFRMGARIFIVY